MEIITNIGSNIGVLLALLVAHRAGLLKVLINGKNNGGDYKRLEDKIDVLGSNHIHTVNSSIGELNETLKRIETKLDKIHEDVIYTKARVNGK